MEISEIPKVRKVEFNHENVPRYYMRGNSLATHFSNALQVLFPEGERFFIRSVQAFSDQITDPDLNERIKGFIGQEIQHGKAHEKFFKHLEEFGLKPDEFESWYKKFAYDWLEKTALKLFSKELAVSVTAAAEHYTATMAELSFQQNFNEGLPESIRDLFLWHAAEEIEHKSVAYDVYQLVDGSYLRRVAGMALASGLLWGLAFAGQIQFSLQDSEMTLARAINDLPGLISNNSKLAAGILPRLLEYFKPDFHPDQTDNLRYAKEFFNKNEKKLLAAKKGNAA